MEKNKYSLVSWLPNFCTTLTCFFGFLAITKAANHSIEQSCYCVFFAAITDFLDGRVARLTGSESDFGAAYDSLADLIAFGLAPALICYHGGLIAWGKAGWSITFLYAIATALRLARFNTSEQNPGAFSGMPCPAAALFIASYVLIIMHTHYANILLFLHLLVAAILQVTSIPFKHTKQIKVSAKFRLLAIFGLVLLMCLVFIYPAWILYALMSTYILYSLIRFCMAVI